MTLHLGTVVCLMSDFFFIAKIEAPLRSLGLEPIFVQHEAEFLGALRAKHPILAIIDLGVKGEDPVLVIQSVREDETIRGTSILCFGSHVNVDAMTRATTAGADEVVSSGQFSAHLPTIVSQYLEE